MTARLRISYLLEDTTLFGGVKVVLRQAELLAGLGHDVTIVTKGEPPTWTEVDVRLHRVAAFERDCIPDSDVVVATYWTTIEAAAAARGRPLHYCQGFEGSHTHNQDDHGRIEAAYRLPMPAMVVSPHLGTLLRDRFGRPSRTVPPSLDACFRASWRLGPGRVPRVLVVGPLEIDWKGAFTALTAIQSLCERGRRVQTVRITQWPIGEREQALSLDAEIHVHIAPERVAEVTRSCDLLLAPSWPQEGFGLPVLESMASGVPVVASRIPCFEGYAQGAASLVPRDEPEAFVAEAQRLFDHRRDWWRARRAGLHAARAFHPEQIALRADEAMRWAADGGGT